MGNALSTKLVIAYAEPDEQSPEDTDDGDVDGEDEQPHAGNVSISQLFGRNRTAPSSRQQSSCDNEISIPHAYAGLHEVLRDFELVDVSELTEDGKPLQIRPRQHRLRSILARDTRSKLVLRAQRIITLSPKIGELFILQQLDLSDNRLTFLPDTFGKLDFLERLDISGNSLVCLPTTFGDLKQLRYLNLERNDLKHLPNSFGRLKRLRRLNLAHNLFTELPECVLGLPRLSHLDIKNNYHITVLPGQLGLLPRLHFLEAMGCDLFTEESQLNQFCQQQSINGTASLFELCVRTLLIKHPVDLQRLPKFMVKELAIDIQACAFCNGPFLWHSVTRGRFLSQPGESVCLTYKMCREHWKDDKSRIRALFHNELTPVHSNQWKDHLREMAIDGIEPDIGIGAEASPYIPNFIIATQSE